MTCISDIFNAQYQCYSTYAICITASYAGCLRSDIGIRMRLIAAVFRSTLGLLFPYQTLWNDLSVPVFDVVGLASLKRGANAFFRSMLLAPFSSFSIFPSSFFLWVVYCQAGVFGLHDRVSIALSRPCITNFV